MDLKHEEVISLSDACRVIPPINGKKTHPSTIWRWCRKGIRGVCLEYVRVGRRMCTSREALGRFFKALADTDQDSTSPISNAPLRIPRDRDNAVAEANEVLSREGVIQ